MPLTSGTPRLNYVIDDFTDPWKNASYMVLQHGFGRNLRFWYQWIPLLSRHFKLIRPDMRGFGASREGFSSEEGFRLNDLSADMARVLDDAGVERAHYVGEAFGGTLGMQFAAQYPDRIRTLSLLSAPVYLLESIQNMFAAGGTSWGDFIRNNGPKAWAERTNTVSRFPDSLGQPFLDWYSEELGHTDAETLARFTELCRSYDQTRFLADIQCPTLGVYSTSRNEQVDTLREHVKDLTVQKIDTKYFMIYLIYPQICASAIAHFAAQHDGVVINA